MILALSRKLKKLSPATAGVLLLAIPAVPAAVPGQTRFDLLLKGGHVIDPRNSVNAICDLAIAGGRIAAVAPSIDPKLAVKTLDVSGRYVTPGLVDIHEHVYSYEAGGAAPDDFALPAGVTTVVDAGSSGWRTFEDFKSRIVDRAQIRVLAMINIVGYGMRGGNYEQDLADMDAKPTAAMALKHKGIVVGIKSANFRGAEWKPYEQAVEAGRIAGVPVMIDYGANRSERPLYDLLTEVLRPSDIYTHVYSGLHGEQDEQTGGPSRGLMEGRKRGVIFDVGHGNGSFALSLAIPMMKAGFVPDSISSDLHLASSATSIARAANLLDVMDKFLAMGMSLDSVILRATWNPAREIKREELGNLSVGSPADVAVLRLENGNFEFTDRRGARLEGTQKLVCNLTIRDGKVVYERGGL